MEAQAGLQPVRISVNVLEPLFRSLIVRTFRATFSEAEQQQQLRDIATEIEAGILEETGAMRRNPALSPAVLDGTVARIEKQSIATMRAAANSIAQTNLFVGNGKKVIVEE